jgi:predicted metal-dependent enzyme (double-stranded beta helix superfamily)
MSAREILQRCLSLSQRLDAPNAAFSETTQASTELLGAELLTDVATWYFRSNTAFSEVEDGHAYSRRELYRDDVGEIVAMQWAPGRVTAPHDHAAARGLVFLLDQQFTERRFHFSAEHSKTGHWVPALTEQLMAPQVLAIRTGVVHDMCCTGAGTSIHVYFPAIAGMRVFDTSSRTIWHVTAEAGAWLPDHPSQVIRSEHW